jgi:hypothetical protein
VVQSVSGSNQSGASSAQNSNNIRNSGPGISAFIQNGTLNVDAAARGLGQLANRYPHLAGQVFDSITPQLRGLSFTDQGTFERLFNAEYQNTAPRENGGAAVTADLPRHYYRISDVAFCSPRELFNTFLEAGGSAPGSPAAREGRTANIGLSGGNPITQDVDSSAMTIVNRTQAGHRYHNGTVTIEITPSIVGSRYTITGEGANSSWARARENEILGTAAFVGIGSLNALECSTGN